MSTNKLKYFEVTQTTVVQANNKTDAISLANKRRGVSGRVLTQLEVLASQISASEAQSWMSA